MSHHKESDKTQSKFAQEMIDSFRKSELGKTNRFPGGKLNKEDQGELMFAVGVSKGRIVLSFKEPVDWLAMEPDDAVALANLLMRHAMDVSRKPVTFEFK